MLAVWPEMKDRLDPDMLFDTYFEADGAPSKTERDPQTLQKVRAAALQQKQAALKLQHAQALAGAYQQTTQAPQEGSPAKQVMDQGGGQ